MKLSNTNLIARPARARTVPPVAMCLEVLPVILEDEGVRSMASNNLIRLSDMVFNFMLQYPDSPRVIAATLHSIVLLARPIGQKEGSLFESNMMNGLIEISDTGYGSGSKPERLHGIIIIYNTMEKFKDNARIMAMACWSLVNISLVDRHKCILMQLGGVRRALDAIERHSEDTELTYRALFCLINFVVPTERAMKWSESEKKVLRVVLGEDASKWDEKATLRESMQDIVSVTVKCMNLYINNTNIVNRGCLILHNLSLLPGGCAMQLLTPGCVAVLRKTYKLYTDNARVRQALEGTLQMLYDSLQNDRNLMRKFDAMSAEDLGYVRGSGGYNPPTSAAPDHAGD